jgi:hypothetical protein
MVPIDAGVGDGIDAEVELSPLESLPKGSELPPQPCKENILARMRIVNGVTFIDSLSQERASISTSFSLPCNENTFLKFIFPLVRPSAVLFNL